MNTAHFILVSFAAMWFAEDAASGAAFVPGEILLNNFTGNVQRYSSTGILQQTYTGTGDSWEGASLTPEGNLVTSFRSPNSGINIFNSVGTQISSFGTSGGAPGDVSVFANGTLAINDQDNNVVRLFSQSRSLLSTINLPGVRVPFGSTVGTDNILYIAGFESNNLARVS